MRDRVCVERRQEDGGTGGRDGEAKGAGIQNSSRNIQESIARHIVKCMVNISLTF